MPVFSVRRAWPWLALLVLLAIAAVPSTILADENRLRRMAEHSLARQTGLPVRIGRMRRIEGWWWTPTLEAHDITLGQARWVASRVPLAHLRAVRARLSLPALLFGRSAVSDIAIDGGIAVLRRNSDARGNWTDKLPGGRGAGETMPAKLTISGLRLIYDDKRRDRRADVIVQAAPRNGILLKGGGRVRGAPVALSAAIGADGRFEAHVAGPALTAAMTGRMDKPYSVAAFTAHLVSSGHDLRNLDALAEAGLPGTQPFALQGDIRHEARSWIIGGISGRIGRSPIDGAVRVDKSDDRSRLTGKLHAVALDFDDLCSDEGLARGAAKARALGPRLVPDTAIALDHLQTTDGAIDVRADRLLWAKPAPFRTLSARLAIEHGVMTLSALRVGLTHGIVTGSGTVTQHGQVTTHLRLDLRLNGGQVEDFAGQGRIDGPLQGRIVVDGIGRTVRDAFGTAGGKVAMVVRGGTMNRRGAELMGRNVGRALKAGADDRVALRCVIIDLRGHNGRFAADPLLLDTAIARADGKGTLDWRTETLAFAVDGGSKVPAAFRLTGPLSLRGTVKQPKFIPSTKAVSPGGLLKMVGRAVGGVKEPVAPDADCAGLAARALR